MQVIRAIADVDGHRAKQGHERNSPIAARELSPIQPQADLHKEQRDSEADPDRDGLESVFHMLFPFSPIDLAGSLMRTLSGMLPAWPETGYPSLAWMGRTAPGKRLLP